MQKVLYLKEGKVERRREIYGEGGGLQLEAQISF